MTVTVNNASQDSKSASRFVLGLLLMISAAHFLNDAVQSIIPAVLPLLRERHALSFAEVGLITLTVQLTTSLLQPAIGYIADRRPSRWGLAFGMFLTMLGMVMLAYESSYAEILAAVALIGCGSALFHPQGSRVAQLSSGGRKGLAQSIFQLGGNAGSAIGPLAAALVIIPLGQHSLAGFALLAGAAMVLLVQVGRIAPIQNRPQDGAQVCGETAVIHPQVRRIFVLLFVLMFSKQVYISSLQSYLTFFVMDKFGLGADQAQYVLFAFLAAGAVGTLVGGTLTDRFGRRRVILGSIFGAAPFALMIPFAGLKSVVFLIVLVSFVMSSAFSAILVCAFDAAPRHTGMISGVFFGFSFGLGGLTAAAFGAAADIFGLNAVFQVTALLPLLGCVAFWLPKETAQRRLV